MPATPLPWHQFNNGLTRPQDAAYIVHASNAYPKLVEALRFVITHHAPTNPLNPTDNARAILRGLGEDA